ncbi:hypothetical protein NQ095_08860 [Rossellomorea sp. SC111]|uniref:hypothetical protein n=1 Tax=Rossellomorea sp. SC111 TaxID=2968985 RepID=UPI00215A3BBD|nr:hypothetical protein [Rossellomorea sp. SC111]MCR8848510.1 hypothetical protein [Rossellomorea sp. SC111]
MSEKTFQMRLWMTAVLASLLMFGLTKFIWGEVNDSLLLVYLVLAFLINVFISKIRKVRTKE